MRYAISVVENENIIDGYDMKVPGLYAASTISSMDEVNEIVSILKNYMELYDIPKALYPVLKLYKIYDTSDDWINDHGGHPTDQELLHFADNYLKNTVSASYYSKYRSESEMNHMRNMAARLGYLEESEYTSGTTETVDLPIE